MMTFIEKVRCAYVSLFYEKLLLYNQDDDNDVETHIARGGREMPRRIAKEIKVIDKEIALVNNWGWVGRPNPKTIAHATQREKWTQTTRREAVSMYTDLRFQSTWQKIEYVVPSLRNENNPVPSVKSYHKAKACQEGSVSYFVGHGINQECHIVDPVFLENCTTSNNKTYFSTKFLNKVKSNPNKKIDLLYQTKQKLKKNMFECHDDIQIHSIKRIVVTVTNKKGKESSVVKFLGRQANGEKVDNITRDWLYANFYEKENTFYRSLVYGHSERLFNVPAGASHQLSKTDVTIKRPTHGPLLKYVQGDVNSCTVCSLASALYAFGDIPASMHVYRRLTEVTHLPPEINRVLFLCEVMQGHHRLKGEERLKYEAVFFKRGKYNILEDESNVPVLCRIQDSSGSTDHCISVLGDWMFDSNFSHSLPRTLKWLNYICSGGAGNSENKTATYSCVYEAVQVTPKVTK
jgi:hypothetical protein